MHRRIYSILLLLIVPAASLQAKTSEELAACMRANLPAESLRQDIEISATDRSGEARGLRATAWVKYEADQRDKVMAQVTAPSDLAGAAYLVTLEADEESIFTYIPALEKVKRISGSSVSGSLWGTDFSYADMRLVQRGFAGGETVLLEPSMVSDRVVSKLRISSAADAESGYKSLVLSIDEQTCVVLVAEFVGENDAIRKRLDVSATSLVQQDGRWTPREMVMHDLEAGTTTSLRILQYDADPKIGMRAFNPRSFYRHRD